MSFKRRQSVLQARSLANADFVELSRKRRQSVSYARCITSAERICQSVLLAQSLPYCIICADYFLLNATANHKGLIALLVVRHSKARKEGGLCTQNQ